ncbi:MAG: hypothetical protein ACI93R_002285 [Flavobacteriales bacterium]|jgi:hypothetical protein
MNAGLARVLIDGLGYLNECPSYFSVTKASMSSRGGPWELARQAKRFRLLGFLNLFED